MLSTHISPQLGEIIQRKAYFTHEVLDISRRLWITVLEVETERLYGGRMVVSVSRWRP